MSSEIILSILDRAEVIRTTARYPTGMGTWYEYAYTASQRIVHQMITRMQPMMHLYRDESQREYVEFSATVVVMRLEDFKELKKALNSG